jgi:hypothetical protein
MSPRRPEAAAVGRYPSSVRSSRLWALLMLPGGLVAGHVIGARIAGRFDPVSAGAHWDLGLLWVIAVPITLAVLARAFVAGLRGELAPVRYSTLALQQIALYVGIELVEHLAAGVTPAEALAERSLLVGALTQVLVAGGLALLIGALRRVGRAVAGVTQPHRARQRACRPWAVTTRRDARPSLVLLCAPRRGPPARLIVA